MKKIQILTDSCSDLTQTLMEKYHIDYVQMNTVYEEKETPASLLWEYYTPQELYKIMRDGNRVKTTQVPPERFEKAFAEYIQNDTDVIYIGCALKQSGSVNTAKVIAQQMMKENPGAKIACIDSLNASIGIGMLCMKASEMVDEGKSFEEIVEAIMALRNRVNEFVTVHSLDCLHRAGRVKGSKAFFGNLLGVKIILISDAEGEQTPIGKAKGRANSLKEIVDRLAENIENPEEQIVYVCHADCKQEELDLLYQLIREKIPCKGIETVYIGPIIGASVGPDTIGVYAFGKEVTYKVSEV